MSKKTAKKQKTPKLSNSGAQIKSIIERFERLAEEKDAIGGDQREIMAEAKGNGFDVKVIRRIIRERKRDSAELAEEEAIYDTYSDAIGHFND